MTNSETREWDRVVDKHTLTETGTVTKRWTHTVCTQLSTIGAQRGLQK